MSRRSAQYHHLTKEFFIMLHIDTVKTYPRKSDHRLKGSPPEKNFYHRSMMVQRLSINQYSVTCFWELNLGTLLKYNLSAVLYANAFGYVDLDLDTYPSPFDSAVGRIIHSVDVSEADKLILRFDDSTHLRFKPPTAPLDQELFRDLHNRCIVDFKSCDNGLILWTSADPKSRLSKKTILPYSVDYIVMFHGLPKVIGL